jgi:hypothetical protein
VIGLPNVVFAVDEARAAAAKAKPGAYGYIGRVDVNDMDSAMTDKPSQATDPAYPRCAIQARHWESRTFQVSHHRVVIRK